MNNETQLRLLTRRSRLVLLLVAGLLLAGSATAGAAALITSKNVADGSLTGRDIRNGTLRGLDVRDASVGKADFDVDVTGAQGPQGPRGPYGPYGNTGNRGPEGAPGPMGPQGRVGLHHWQVVLNANYIPAGERDSWSAECPTGMEVIGGGVWSDDAPYGSEVRGSGPGNSRWRVAVRNTRDTGTTVTAFAVCFTRHE
jgi:hypothetical protein